LAKDVYDGIKGVAGIPDDVQLPPDVIKQIFGSLSFLTPKEIDSWIDTTLKWKKNNDIPDASSGDESAEGSDLKKPFKVETPEFSSTGKKAPKSLDEATRNKIRNLLTEDTLNGLVFDSRKRRGIGEYTENNKHKLASWTINSEKKQVMEDFTARQKNAPNRLSEAFKVRIPDDK
jgi:predicted transglutaminase-like protease